MVVGILQFELEIPGALSLKDKRRVVRSVKDRLHREHQVSVAEVGALDRWRTAEMGVSIVSNSAPYVSAVFDRVLRKLGELPEARLGEVRREILSTETLPGETLAEDGSPLWTDSERRGDEGDAPTDAAVEAPWMRGAA